MREEEAYEEHGPLMCAFPSSGPELLHGLGPVSYLPIPAPISTRVLEEFKPHLSAKASRIFWKPVRFIDP
jgi:hypothetical protein